MTTSITDTTTINTNNISIDGRRILFLMSSSRSNGNTELLARRAAEALPPSVTQVWLRLSDLPLTPFYDLRHSTEHYALPESNELLLLTETLTATDIVFVAPTYWYNLPASAKLYLDYWTKWMRLPGYDFKARLAGKTLSVITVYAGDSKADDWNIQPLVDSLRSTAAFMGMRWCGALIGHANRPGDVLQDGTALDEAQDFL